MTGQLASSNSNDEGVVTRTSKQAGSKAGGSVAVAGGSNWQLNGVQLFKLWTDLYYVGITLIRSTTKDRVKTESK